MEEEPGGVGNDGNCIC